MKTDLERFKELYASVGVDVSERRYGAELVLTLTEGDYEFFGGYNGFGTDIRFNQEGKFLGQNFWE
jgi:hypothetical protein